MLIDQMPVCIVKGVAHATENINPTSAQVSGVL